MVSSWEKLETDEDGRHEALVTSTIGEKILLLGLNSSAETLEILFVTLTRRLGQASEDVSSTEEAATTADVILNFLTDPDLTRTPMVMQSLAEFEVILKRFDKRGMCALDLDELHDFFKTLGKNGGWADQRIHGWRHLFKEDSNFLTSILTLT